PITTAEKGMNWRKIRRPRWYFIGQTWNGRYALLAMLRNCRTLKLRSISRAGRVAAGFAHGDPGKAKGGGAGRGWGRNGSSWKRNTQASRCQSHRFGVATFWHRHG